MKHLKFRYPTIFLLKGQIEGISLTSIINIIYSSVCITSFLLPLSVLHLNAYLFKMIAYFFVAGKTSV